MSGPYGPQSTQELLERLVEEKGAMYADDVAKWVDYVDAYIERQKQAHGNMVIGKDEVEDIDLSRGAKSRWGVRARNRVRAECRLRNQTGDNHER